MSVGLQRLRDEPDVIRKGAIDKGEDPTLVDRALELDSRRRQLLGESEALKAERNAASKRIGEAIKGGARADGPEVADLKAASVSAGERITSLDAELATVEATLDELLLRIPNPADLDVPVGGEEANVTVRTWGELFPRDQTVDGETWQRKPHWELGETLDIIDSARGAKIAGSGFPVYKGAGSALQRGLINWFLDVHTRENGFTEVWPPAVVNTASATGTGQIPDKDDQMYVVTRDELYLVPTAEVPVTNLHRDEILDAAVEVMLNRKPTGNDVQLEVRRGVTRPVWEPDSRVLALHATAEAIAKRIGFALPHQSSGGGSDGNFTGAMGIPTLDGLGIMGALAHTLEEHVMVSSMAPRAKLFAGLLQSV